MKLLGPMLPHDHEHIFLSLLIDSRYVDVYPRVVGRKFTHIYVYIYFTVFEEFPYPQISIPYLLYYNV